MFNGKLKDVHGGKVLDVGTGRGEFIRCLSDELKSFDEIIGIDPSEKAVASAANNFKDEKIRFVKMDGEHMEFKDESFDMVCISNTLHHLPADKMHRVLNEMRRVLKTGGYFIICEMYCDNQNNKQMGHVKFHHFNAEIDNLMGVYHAETFKREEILKIGSNIGISIYDTVDFVDDEEVPPEDLREIISSLAKRTESLCERDNYNDFKKKSEEVKNWLLNYGLSGATELTIIGRK